MHYIKCILTRFSCNSVEYCESKHDQWLPAYVDKSIFGFSENPKDPSSQELMLCPEQTCCYPQLMH